MAMSLSSPETLLGQEQLDQHERWADAGLLALVGIGVEPGLSDVFARYAADHLFAEIDEVGVRDGADLAVEGYEFAPTFSIWTTIEECLNPPLIWERDRGWYTTEPFSEPEVFDFPEGIGPLECVNVEHEEVVLVPRWVECNRVTFKYGLGEEFIDVLKTLHKLGLDSKEPISVRGVEVAPRDVLAAALPDPATLGDRMHGKTCAGTFVTGTGKDGEPRSTYLYHVVRQRADDARVRLAGGRAADGAEPGRRARAARGRHLEGRGRARPGGVRRGAVPRAARRLRRAARPRRPVSETSEARAARTSPAWPVAALMLGAGLLALLLLHPGIDESWENHPAHFWLVLGAASISVALGYAVGVAARRRRDARLFLVSLAFISTSGFLGLHALATPGVLLGKNAGFELGDAVRARGRGPLRRRPRRSLRPAAAESVLRCGLGADRGPRALFAAWAVISLAELPPLDGRLGRAAGRLADRDRP